MPFDHDHPTMPNQPNSPPADSSPVLTLVHEGWSHLKRQRPLAAWASWRQALRFEPEQPAAKHALDVLANAADLPEAARAEYRFLTPVSDEQRTRWDAELRSRDLADLGVAAESFACLATPTDGQAVGDGRARFNQGLCLAWLGRNPDAVTALDQAVEALAESEPGVAVDAGALAEILRQGAGAETLADDLNYMATFTWPSTASDPTGFLDRHPNIRAIPTPIDPASGEPARANIRLFEWLDDPAPIRRLQATLIRSGHSLRLSGPDPIALEEAVTATARLLGDQPIRWEREATPLPLAFLDAAVWAVRLPNDLEPEAVDDANRAAVERYYETVWINRPRKGLGGRSPVEAGQLASAGDPVMQARLAAVVRVREQLGARTSTLALYQGYPFDRLRRRVGLAAINPEAVDPGDVASMSPTDLDALDPKTMNGFDLVDAFESAAALGDDARTGRFAAWLADLDPTESTDPLRRVDLAAVFATLVRQALAEDDPDLAVEWIDRALVVDQAVHSGGDERKFTTWRAEVLARTGQPDSALLVYRQLIEQSPNASIALDAAETMLDNGHNDQARTLAAVALELAQRTGDDHLADRAEGML